MKVYVFDNRVQFISYIERLLQRQSSSRYELTYSGDIFDTATTEHLGNIWWSESICLSSAEIICLN